MTEEKPPNDTITFLGTGGARYVVMYQLLATGGMWLNLGGTQILVDPGPGCLVHAVKKKLRAEKLSAIILSHRHLDHSNDANIMVEAMTRGGYSRRGKLFLPADALGTEPVVYSYLRSYLDGIEILEAGKSYSVDNVSFSVPIRHHHGVETYGMVFTSGKYTFSYVPDSKLFDGLATAYRGDLLIMNIVRMDTDHPFEHMSISDAGQIIGAVKPKMAILTHFGMGIYRAHPWEVAEKLTQDIGIKVIAARDGMTFPLSKLHEAPSA